MLAYNRAFNAERYHNIERSSGMLKQLESIGIFDNTAGRALIKVAEGARVAEEAVKEGKDIVGTAYDAIKPTQDWINPAKVAEYKSLLQSGQKIDPIISYKNGRGIFIEDGHHRFAAYMELGLKPNMIIRNTGGPVGFPNWLSTTFQTP